MKLLLIGDVHGELKENRAKFKQLLELNKQKVDYVIQAGDLGFYEPMPLSSYFIFGNNEDFDIIQAMLDGEVEYENLKLIKSGEAILLRKGSNSLVLAGLCGNYAPKYFNLRREELTGDRRRHFVAEEVQRCLLLSNIDLFLAHEAPFGLIRRRGYDVGVRHITTILKTIKPRYLFSGHHHEFAYRRIEKSECYSLGSITDGYLIYDSKSNVIKKFNINGREIAFKRQTTFS
jgi:predicted phosphodiesterase